jgi:hypothetical protein
MHSTAVCAKRSRCLALVALSCWYKEGLRLTNVTGRGTGKQDCSSVVFLSTASADEAMKSNLVWCTVTVTTTCNGGIAADVGTDNNPPQHWELLLQCVTSRAASG